jgi:hypothetical protein
MTTSRWSWATFCGSSGPAPGELESEFLQLLTFVVLTTFLIHRNSHESRDSDDRMQQSLDRIEKRLKALEGEAGKARASS